METGARPPRAFTPWDGALCPWKGRSAALPCDDLGARAVATAASHRRARLSTSAAAGACCPLRGCGRGGHDRGARDAGPAARVWGVGAVHHVAWRVDDEAIKWRFGKESRRRPASTEVIDRFWGNSVYFLEPGGVLFELATDGPGFTVDEELTIWASRSSCRRGSSRRQEIEKYCPPWRDGCWGRARGSGLREDEQSEQPHAPMARRPASSSSGARSARSRVRTAIAVVPGAPCPSATGELQVVQWVET